MKFNPTRIVQKSSQGQKQKGPAQSTPYRPPVPFPQRLRETKINEQFGKFMECLKQLQITIPFTEALTQMPTYTKFLKDILLNKRSLEGRRTVKLTKQCSAILKNDLPPKLDDPDKFSIPCTIGKASIKQALCDMEASVNLMPRSLYECLGVGELKPTRMTLQLADAFVRLPLGVIENVPIQVGKFFVPCDFVVMEMEEDKDVPIILGRPFLRTAGALIDVKDGTLTLRIGDEKMQFDLNHAMKYPDDAETCCVVDVVDQLTKGQLHKQYGTSFKNYPDYLSESQEKERAEEMARAVEAKSVKSEKQYMVRADQNPDRVPPSEELPHRSDEAHTQQAYGPNVRHPARAQAQLEQPRVELKHLAANLDSDHTAKLLEDLQAQQTMIERLIEKLMSANPAAHMHRTFPANDHRHMVRADLHTDCAQAVLSV